MDDLIERLWKCVRICYDEGEREQTIVSKAIDRYRSKKKSVPSAKHSYSELYELMTLPRCWPRHSIVNEDKSTESSLMTCEIGIKQLMELTAMNSECAVMTIVIAALTCISVDFNEVFKFGIFPEHPIYRFHEDITLILYDTTLPICSIEVKKKISQNIDTLSQSHLKQMFLYAYYFMEKYSFPLFRCILTDLDTWCGFICQRGERMPLKVTGKCYIISNYDLYTFLNNTVS